MALIDEVNLRRKIGWKRILAVVVCLCHKRDVRCYLFLPSYDVTIIDVALRYDCQLLFKFTLPLNSFEPALHFTQLIYRIRLSEREENGERTMIGDNNTDSRICFPQSSE